MFEKKKPYHSKKSVDPSHLLNETNVEYALHHADTYVVPITQPARLLSQKALDKLYTTIALQAVELRCEPCIENKYTVEFTSEEINLLRNVFEVYEMALANYSIGKIKTEEEVYARQKELKQAAKESGFDLSILNDK